MKTNDEHMILKRIQLENFKCFKKKISIDLGKLTILTGANSSGKSSILYGLLGALQSKEFPFEFSINGNYINMGDFRDISNKHSNKEIKINFSFFSEGINKTHEVETTWINNKINNLPTLSSFIASSDFYNLHIKKDKNYVVNFEYSYEKDPANRTDEQVKLINNLYESLNEIMKKGKQEDDKKNKSNKKIKPKNKQETSPTFNLNDINSSQKIENETYETYQDLMKISGDKKGSFRIFDTIQDTKRIFKEFEDNFNFISSFRLHPERTYLEESRDNIKLGKSGEKYLDQIIQWENNNSPQLKSLLKTMSSIELLHQLKSHRLGGGRFEMLVDVLPKSTKVAISDVGFGISQFMPILIADLQLRKNSTLFVSQPEIHIHPNIQALYAQHLFSQIKEFQKNYVIETHSEYFLNRIRLGIVKGDIQESDIAIYYLENTKEDIELHKIQFGKRGQITGAPDSFFKTYMMDIRDIALNIKS